MAIRKMIEEPQAFLALWLVGWLVAEVFVAVAWSWLAFGEEVVTIASGTLTIARKVGRWQIARHFSLQECSNLRASGWFGPTVSFAESLRPWGLTGGTVAIDCNSEPVRFGIALDEGEAHAVANELQPFVAGRPTGAPTAPPRTATT